MTDPLEPRAIIVTVLHPRLSSSKEEAPTSGKHGLLATVFTIPWTCCSSTWPGELRVSPYVKCDDERGIHYRGWQSTVKLARFPPPFHGRMNVSLLFPILFLTISALGCPARTCVTSDSLPDVTVRYFYVVIEFVRSMLLEIMMMKYFTKLLDRKWSVFFFSSLFLSLLVIGHRGFFYRNELILWLMELFIYYFFFL